MLTVREISSKRDVEEFIRFPERLYRDCPQYVPALRGDQRKSLTDCAPLRYCTRRMWLATDGDGRTVGRICGIVNPRYNERYGTRRARFGWFDTVDDIAVAGALLETAEKWAKDLGMNEIHGPLYYNTLGKQGMLVEGFDRIPAFNTLYNYAYYPRHVEALGYRKECDWLEYRMPVDQPTPEKLVRVAAQLRERYGLHAGSLARLKKDPVMVRKFFGIYNEAFGRAVYNFIPFTDEEIEEEARAFLPWIDDRYSVILLDRAEEPVAFGIAVPDISRALQKARGRLFPTGWWHLLRAMRRRPETLDLMISGAVPAWQNTGISAVYLVAGAEKYRRAGVRWGLANPQLETNAAVNVWGRYGNELYMRRRCYIKEI